MRKHVRFTVIIAMLIMFSLLGVNLTQAQQTGETVSPADALSLEAKIPWQSEYADQFTDTTDVGEFTSLALRPFDDIPYVSYYDSDKDDLMLAYRLPHGGGNCGTNNNWHCEILDGGSGVNVGQYSSLAFWGNEATQGWKIGISYYDVTNRALKFTSWSCGGLLCTIKNTVTIDAPPVISTQAIGKYSSLKFGPDGSPIIAFYYESTIGNDSLRLASYVGSGGNCGEGSAAGKWKCEIIDNGDQRGEYASLDLTYDGSIYIAYYDGALGNLKMAYYTGIADPHCYNTNGWMCPVLDSVGNVGLYPSLTAQHSAGDQLFRIAYYDATNKHLKYTDETWSPLVVDEMGSSTSLFMGISMEVDKDGAPIIAYQQVKPGDFSRPTLNVARPYFVYGDGNFGNCGTTPPGYLFTYWRCNVLDHAGQYVWEADFASVVVKSSGLAAIAYSEFDEYYDATSLKFISQIPQFYLPVVTK